MTFSLKIMIKKKRAYSRKEREVRNTANLWLAQTWRRMLAQAPWTPQFRDAMACVVYLAPGFFLRLQSPWSVRLTFWKESQMEDQHKAHTGTLWHLVLAKAGHTCSHTGHAQGFRSRTCLQETARPVQPWAALPLNQIAFWSVSSWSFLVLPWFNLPSLIAPSRPGPGRAAATCLHCAGPSVAAEQLPTGLRPWCLQLEAQCHLADKRKEPPSVAFFFLN